jgi:hypothetical protein
MKKTATILIMIFSTYADERIDQPSAEILPFDVSQLMDKQINRVNKVFSEMSKTSTVIAHSQWSKDNMFTAQKCAIRRFSDDENQFVYLVEIPSGVKDFDFIVISTKRGDGHDLKLLKP